jgi:Icc protein
MRKGNAGELSRRSFLLGLAGMACSVTLPIPAKATVGVFDPFTFAFVTDVHLTNSMPDSYELLHESQLFLQDVVKQLNSEKLDFIIFGGDQVQGVGRDEANWNLFLDIAQGLNAPWTFILGEDDIMGETGSVDKMRTFGPDWKGKGIETEKSYWSYDPLPGIHIIGLDTSLPNSTMGDVSPRQLDWLKQDLAANRKKFIAVFSHHPLLPPPPYDSGSPWDDYTIPQGAAVREVIGSSPFVHLAVSGHVPIAKVQQERDIWYVSSPSLVTYPCAYRLFRVTPDNVTIQNRVVGFPALVKKARKALLESSLAYKYDNAKPEAFVFLAEGSREDQNSILNFDRNSAPKPTAQQKPQKPGKKKKEKAPKESKSSTKQPAKESPKEAPKEPAHKSGPEPASEPDKSTEQTPPPSEQTAPPAQPQPQGDE